MKNETLSDEIIGTRCQCGFSRTSTIPTDKVKLYMDKIKAESKTTEEIENMWDAQTGNPPYPLEKKKWVAVETIDKWLGEEFKGKKE